MNEKYIMSKLRHPFIINMAATYQDENFLYMLLGIVQGGELFSLMHTSTRDGIPESQAKFYAACIAEGLAFMHRRGFVYRDLKVSFGFFVSRAMQILSVLKLMSSVSYFLIVLGSPKMF